jgi:hypothetical protein
VKAAQYCVVAFPKLDNEAQFQRLREKFDPLPYRVRPYIPVVLPFTPANLDEIQSVSDHVSTARRCLHPLAITFQHCVSRGEYLCYDIDEGRDGAIAIHERVVGGDPLPLLEDTVSYEPLVWVCRVPDPVQRAAALVEAGGIGRTLGIVDALSIIRINPDEELKLVAVFPFGIGRVDYYERLTG